MFFPVTGYGNGNGLANETQLGAYWSSSVSSGGTFDQTKNAVCLILKNPNANAIVPNAFDILGAPAAEADIYNEGAGRYYGCTVRPIYNPTPEVPTLSGKFTINESGDQVYFSRGNLYYENSVPKFEANQFDYRIYFGKEDDQAVIDGVLTTTPSGNVGSFFWCDNAAAACAETYEDETPATKFFAEELTVYGTEYCSLTKAEWEYLLGTGEKRNGLHRKDVTIKIEGGETVQGLVVAPDGFNASNFKDEYTIEEWKKAESDYNLVFLPAVGFIDEDGDIQSPGSYYGYYWLSDYNLEEPEWVYYLDFGSIYAEVSPDHRYTGYSVRLVKRHAKQQGR